MKNIAFAGSFDIFTNGHEWVMKAGLEVADNVTVIVADNSAKKYMFTTEERVAVIQSIIDRSGISDRVKVISSTNEFVANRVSSLCITHMIRGIRNSVDFDQEKLAQRFNFDMLNVQTVFVMPPSELESVSSSVVRSLIGPESWTFYVKKLIPEETFRQLLKKRIIAYSTDDCTLNDKILDAYTGCGRHYHNLEHIVNVMDNWCINTGDSLKNHPSMFFAILLHDVVYKGSPDASFWGLTSWKTDGDEERSAEVAKHLGYSYKIIDLILSTRYGYPYDENNKDCKAMRSADLSILGQAPDVYAEYSSNIRKEYGEYNDSSYRAGRKQVLELLLNQLNQDKLYLLPQWKRKYSENARRNLKKEISGLNVS